jgi:hypothetical protein
MGKVIRTTAKFALGLPLTQAKTDATAFRRATKVTHESGRASRWAHLSHAHRAAYRLGTVGTASAALAGYLTHPLLTESLGAGAGASGAAYGLYRARRGARAWNRRRTVTRPLAKALAPIVEMAEIQVDTGLHVPETTNQPGDYVRVPLPDHYAGRAAQMADVTRIVNQRIGGEWDASWQLKTSPFYINFTPKPAPPGMVRWADIVDAVRETTQGKPVLGLGARSEIIHLNFDGEIAHLAASIGTGGGKSSFLRAQVAQFSYHGVDEFHIFDTKMVSLQGMEAIPGINYYVTVPKIWDGIAYLRAEMDRRYTALLKDPNATFPRIIMIFEEQNAYAIESSIYWKQNREKGQKEQTPPVWSDFAMLLLKARQVNMNALSMYQYLNNVAVGNNIALRGQYGLKLLGRFDPQMWDLLVDTKPRMESSAIAGRAVMVMGSVRRVVQFPYVEASEAVAFALSRPDRPGVVTVTGEAHPHVTAESRRDVTPEDVVEPRFTLPDACRAGILPMTADAARQARYRDRRKPIDQQIFPMGIRNDEGEETYTAGELRYWIESRVVTDIRSKPS